MGCPIEEYHASFPKLRVLPPSNDLASIPDNFWGEWEDIKTGTTRYIDDSNDDNLSRLTDTVITDNGGALLYPIRVANASFSGKVAILSVQNASVRAIGGLGGIQGTVTNLKNAADDHSFTTDENGEYEVDGVIPGDTYVVEVEEAKIEFTPAGDGDNAGTITLNDEGGANFKVSFTQDDRVYGSTRNGSGNWLYIPITVTNTGTVDATAATYQLTLEDGLFSNTTSMTGVLGTIEPGKTKQISISVACLSDSIPDDYAFKAIDVQITDPIHNRTWHDSVSVKFYKKEVEFTIVPGNLDLSGMFVTPSGAYQFGGNNYQKGYYYDDRGWQVDITYKDHRLPLITGNYTILFYGASADTETFYAFGIEQGIKDLKNMMNSTDTARYEPNDTDQTATVITGMDIVAYVHKNDFDYYKFRLAYY
jgi:hypothetical protein